MRPAFPEGSLVEADRSQYMISGRRWVWHVPREQRRPRCWETWGWGRLGMERGRRPGSNTPLEKGGSGSTQNSETAGPISWPTSHSTEAENGLERAHGPRGLPAAPSPLPSAFLTCPPSPDPPGWRRRRVTEGGCGRSSWGWGGPASEKPVGEAAPPGCGPAPSPGLENALSTCFRARKSGRSHFTDCAN